MTLFLPDEKDISKKLLEYEKAELGEYCKQQGFTKEQTETFIKNSIKSMYANDWIDD